MHSFESLLHHAGERIVNVGGTGCACGGTHVKNTADIRGITVTKIKKVLGVSLVPGFPAQIRQSALLFKFASTGKPGKYLSNLVKSVWIMIKLRTCKLNSWS